MSYQSFDGYGVDVAMQRADSLDKKTLAYVAEQPGCRVLDLGSGAGGQSLRMANAGACVTAVDRYDFTEQFAQYEQPADRLRFVLGDVQALPTLLPDQTFDVALCQRTIHYLPYAAALNVLKELSLIIYDKLYISVTGLGSLVGETYPCATATVTDRFCELSPLGKDMFDILKPVCLYSQAEFTELLTAAGWTIDACTETAFGNIQAECSRAGAE